MLVLISCARGPDTSAPKIYGGEPVGEGELEGVVGLAFRDDRGLFRLGCSGTVIADAYVLTAAHCLEGLPIDDPAALADKIRVVTGTGVEGGIVADTGIRVRRAILHPLFRRHPEGQADAALLELEEAAPVPSLRLASRQSELLALVPRTPVTLVGFGRREDGGSGRKFAVQTPLLARTGHEAHLGGSGRDACAGDSGGPALVWRGGAFVQIGIVQRANGFGCGSGGIVGLTFDVACWAQAKTGLELGADCPPNDVAYSDDALRAMSLEALCLEKDLPSGMARTLEALRHAVGAPCCLEAAERLKEIRQLDLDYMMLTDLAPLATLPRLERLSLRGNHLAKVAPLRLSTSLRQLDVSGNFIDDLESLSGLEHLRIRGRSWQSPAFLSTPFLAQCDDGVGDDEALVRALIWKAQTDDCEIANLRLIRMQSLSLRDRGIETLEALAGFWQLRTLDLRGNPISDVTPLAALENLRSLDLRGTNVTDTSPLAPLIDEGLEILLD